MNKDIFQGQWNILKGKVKEQWGKLTDDDLREINGKKEQLLGKIQSRYGYAKDRAEKEIKSFEEELEPEFAHHHAKEEHSAHHTQGTSKNPSKTHPSHAQGFNTSQQKPGQSSKNPGGLGRDPMQDRGNNPSQKNRGDKF